MTNIAPSRARRRRVRRWLITAGAVLAVGAGCADSPTPPVGEAMHAPVTVSATLTPAQQAVIAGMSVEVTGSGIGTPIIATLSVNGATVNGTVQVPVGANRTFTVRAFDAQGTETYEGSASADVAAGTNAPLTVRLLAREGTVPIDVTVGTYGVTLTPATASVQVNAEVTLTANVTTNGTTVSGPLTWGVVNPALVTLTVAADGRSAVVRGKLAGTTRVVASYEGTAAASTVTITPAANQPPVANANGPYTGTVGVPITFSSAGSSDPDGFVVRREWLFGDGTGSDVANPTKTYTAAGTYTVTLRVVDDDNAATTVTTTATIAAPANQAPSVQLHSTSYLTYVRQILNVTASGSDPDGTVVQYRWAFSDQPNFVHTTTAGSVAREFEVPGTFSVSVVAVDDKGAVSPARSASIIVNSMPSGGNQVPVVNINGPYSGAVGTAIQFSSQGTSDPDGTIVSYAWQFGDGGTSTLASPSHTYTAAGTYTVSLTVRDNAGAQTTRSTTATIGTPPANQAPTVSMQSQFVGMAGVPVTISASGSDPDGTIASYRWQFSDELSPRSSTTGSISRTFASRGIYQVAVAAVDDRGAMSTSKTAIITIQ